MWATGGWAGAWLLPACCLEGSGKVISVLRSLGKGACVCVYVCEIWPLAWAGLSEGLFFSSAQLPALKEGSSGENTGTSFASDVHVSY